MKKYELSEVSQIEPKVGERFIIVYDGNEFEFKPFYYEDDIIIEPDMVAGYNVFYNGEYIRNWNDPELDPYELETEFFAEIERNVLKSPNDDTIESIGMTARQNLVNVIRGCLDKQGEIEVNVDIYSNCDEDRYTHTTIKSVAFDEDKNVVLNYEDDEGEEYSEDIMLFSFDEIFKIAKAVV